MKLMAGDEVNEENDDDDDDDNDDDDDEDEEHVGNSCSESGDITIHNTGTSSSSRMKYKEEKLFKGWTAFVLFIQMESMPQH